MTERDFVVFLGQIAGKLRDTDWEPSTDDLSESLYGMTEHLWRRAGSRLDILHFKNKDPSGLLLTAY